MSRLTAEQVANNDELSRKEAAKRQELADAIDRLQLQIGASFRRQDHRAVHELTLRRNKAQSTLKLLR